MKRLFFLVIMGCAGWAAASAQTADVLHGTVTDKKTGEPLPGASIEIAAKGSTPKQRDLHLLSGLDGSFILRHIAAGHYEVSVKVVGYERFAEEMDLADGKGLALSAMLEIQRKELAAVSVTAAGSGRGTERASQLADRRADIVQNSLSARAIEVSPDLTVASTAQRVSGVTLERSTNGEAQYVIIRGMEKRYIYTLVNGIKIPSPDNKNRYVPLDIFPADMLERLEIFKSLTPNMEADGIGGAVNMVMKDAPARFSVNANAALGYANDFFKQDFSKFDAGPSLKYSPRELNGPNYVATMKDFPNSAFSHSISHNPFGEVLGLSLGGRLFGDHLGVMVAGSFQNNYRNVHSVLFGQPDQVVDGGVQLASVADRHFSIQQQRSGAHLRLDYRLDARNNISFYGAYMNLMREEFRSISDTNLELNRVGPGFGRVSNSYRDLHEVQQISNYTLKGRHELGDNFLIDWTAAYSRATLNRPDEATLNYDGGVQKDPVTGAKVPDPATLEESTREFTHSTDEDKSGYLNLTYRSRIAAAKVDWSIGGMYRDKHRTSAYDEYDLRPDPGGQVYNGNAGQNNFDVFNGQGTSDNALNYTAEEKVAAGYAMAKIDAGAFLITGGARYEHTDLSWNSFVPETVTGKTGDIYYYDVLPSGNIKYSLGRKQALRISYYSAISRPNFYEVIPHTLLDQESGQTEKGNPHLKRTTADNFDLRYEYYPKGLDQLLVGVFYKKLNNPIEYSITNAPDPLATISSSNMTYYIPQNFGNATNYGAELDITKYWRSFGIKANYTYTDSKITTTKEHDFPITGGTKTEYPNQTRPLQGQSRHIANFSLLFKDDNRLGLNAQLAFQYTSRRINTVSQFYNYDIWQKDFEQLDLSVEKRVAHRWYIYAKVNNLLNTPYQLEIRQPYTPGAVASYAPYQTVGKDLTFRKDVYGVNYLLGVKFKL
ncbi:MAG TPA: TonB-dependent receptor [Puia sp.]|jgi:outer membrane receptor protein involved in Fe transport